MCFFNDTATTEIYTLSLHDALPILPRTTGTNIAVVVVFFITEAQAAAVNMTSVVSLNSFPPAMRWRRRPTRSTRSEEHTSELQSRQYLVCRLLLEKKNHTTFRYRRV